MQRTTATYQLREKEAAIIKARMLNWAAQFSIFIYLDSNSYPVAYGQYECLLAAGRRGGSNIMSMAELAGIDDQQSPDWLFGHICYDYKNIVEPRLFTIQTAHVGFPLLHFFTPEHVCYLSKDQSTLTIESLGDPWAVLSGIMASAGIIATDGIPALQFSRRVEEGTYKTTIERLRAHIACGDCYEINFCTEGYSSGEAIPPLQVFSALNSLSPAPFAAYYRYEDKYMMCASPERYLQKSGVKLISQPIKGTARRGSSTEADEEIKETLRRDPKELAENVMIADLVRNDLARCCETGSVVAEELFGIYTFPQVHQMISTIGGMLKKGAHFTEALNSSFPMGSMTGAPKYKVMQLTDRYEQSARELYAGTVGYITPSRDFDFNVVIRSLFYNESTKYLSYHTGGAITYDSTPEQEWEELRLKAWALERIFNAG